jgi:hypothetical protein
VEQRPVFGKRKTESFRCRPFPSGGRGTRSGGRAGCPRRRSSRGGAPRTSPTRRRTRVRARRRPRSRSGTGSSRAGRRGRGAAAPRASTRPRSSPSACRSPPGRGREHQAPFRLTKMAAHGTAGAGDRGGARGAVVDHGGRGFRGRETTSFRTLAEALERKALSYTDRADARRRKIFRNARPTSDPGRVARPETRMLFRIRDRAYRYPSCAVHVGSPPHRGPPEPLHPREGVRRPRAASFARAREPRARGPRLRRRRRAGGIELGRADAAALRPRRRARLRRALAGRVARRADGPGALRSARPRRGGGRSGRGLLSRACLVVGERLWGSYVRRTASALVALDAVASARALPSASRRSAGSSCTPGVDAEEYRPGISSGADPAARDLAGASSSTSDASSGTGARPLVQAFARTVGQRDDWSLVLVGEGSARGRAARARSTGSASARASTGSAA